MESGLQKKDPKSNSIGIAFETITNAFCIEDDNKEKAEFALSLLNQIVRAGYDNDDSQKMSDNTLAAISDIKPKDTIEAMLASQMLAIHNAAMKNLTRANGLLSSRVYKEIELGTKAFNVANKLARTYTTQMETLQRYRGKGQQKMIIEHVNVNSGGQAIIGNVETNKKLK